jgi:hypothetical protein
MSSLAITTRAHTCCWSLDGHRRQSAEVAVVHPLRPPGSRRCHLPPPLSSTLLPWLPRLPHPAAAVAATACSRDPDAVARATADARRVLRAAACSCAVKTLDLPEVKISAPPPSISSPSAPLSWLRRRSCQSLLSANHLFAAISVVKKGTTREKGQRNQTCHTSMTHQRKSKQSIDALHPYYQLPVSKLYLKKHEFQRSMEPEMERALDHKPQNDFLISYPLILLSL